MKQLLLLSAIFASFCSALNAQIVLTSTMPRPPIGTVDSVFGASGSIPPGNGGAAVTWNLSSLSASLLGSATIVNPAASPYAANFPTANFCIQITPAGGGSSAYEYDSISTTRWDQLSNNYMGPGTGKDFTPNPESNLEFPFNYGTSFIDTYQTTTSGPYSFRITYDGYGTLITPLATFNNVVRVIKYWGPGDSDIDWVSTSPYLFILCSYDAQSNKYTFINPTATAVNNVMPSQSSVQVYPNPVTDKAIIITADYLNNAQLVITDLTGRMVKQVAIRSAATNFNRDNLAPGMYFYVFYNNQQPIAKGKLLIE
jgi:hypothetical protein